jgi:hypothetical protein
MSILRLSVLSAVLLCLAPSGTVLHARAGALIHLSDPCRIAPSPVRDPLSAYIASLDRAEMQAFNAGNTACLSRLATGTEQARTLQWVQNERAAHRGMILALHSVVANAHVLPANSPQANASTVLNGVDCATLNATVFRAVRFKDRGSMASTAPQHQATMVEQYALRDLAFSPDFKPHVPLYVTLTHRSVAVGPLPAGATGAFAAALAGAVDRYLITLPAGNPSMPALLPLSVVRALARMGFIIGSASGQSNFFGVYGNEGSDAYANNVALSVPSFITLDAGLHTFHVLFDRTLMTAESVSLRPRLQALLADLLEATIAQRRQLSAPAALAANAKNAVYLAVPLRLVGGTLPSGSLSDAQRTLVMQETALVQAHAGPAFSPFLVQRFDYRLFKPRGHYTYGPDLESYFEAMNWLALVQAPLEAGPGVPLPDARAGALRAALMAALMPDTASGRVLLAQWHRLADPITVLIGAPAGPSLSAIMSLVGRVYGSGAPPISVLQSSTRLNRFLALVHTLPPVPYRSTSSAGSKNLRGFGLFPARAVADGTLAAALTYPHVGTLARPRALPNGLDVMAALGSARAQQLVQQTGPWRNYDTALARAKPTFQRALRASTLYARWLAALQPLARPMPAAAPPVMHTTAWSDKELMTGLASWSELRHDSILYASQFAGGGAGKTCQAPLLFRYGYVEPIPAAWQDLAALADRLAFVTRGYGLFAGLPIGKRKALLAAEDAYRQGLRTLAGIAEAELTHRPIGPDEALLINNAYPILGNPMAVFFTQTPHAMMDQTSTRAAEIADVATNLVTGQVLEVGEGPVRATWVLVPIGDFTWLMRGEVYTYYEFTTNGQRLSDQEWQHNFEYGRPAAMHEPPWVEAITR